MEPLESERAEPLRLRFADFELDEERFELRRGGVPVRISRKPMELLLLLARNAPRVVRKREIVDQLWAGTAVSDSAIALATSRTREALGGGNAAQSVIQTVHGVGLRFVAEIEPLRSAPLPKRVADETLVGRAAERYRIGELLARMEAGEGRLLLVGGVAGVGKTTLLAWAAESARARGALVLASHAWEGPETPAFALWTDVLRSLVENLGAELLLGDQDVLHRAQLAHLVPSLGEPAAPRGGEIRPEEAQFQLLEAIALCLHRAAGSRPLVVVLEDLHVADRGSLQVLRFLAGRIAGDRILVLGSFRSDEVEPPRAHALGELDRFPSTECINLQGLDRVEARELIQRELHVDLPPAATASLTERTDGNPLFIKEILRLHQEAEGAGRSEVSSDVTDWTLRLTRMSPLVQSLLMRRLERQPTEMRQVLEIAAVIGQRFDLAVLAGASEFERDGALLALLTQASEAGLVQRLADRHAYAFHHALTREALYDSLDERRRAQLHLRVGEAIEALHDGSPGAEVANLATHFHRAAPLVSDDRAVRYARLAGEQARDALAFEDGALWFERALEALNLRPEVDPKDRAELLVCLGFAHHAARNRERALEVLLEAAQTAKHAGAPELMAMAALGYAEYGLTDQDATTTVLLEEAALALGAGTSLLHVWTHTSLAARLATVPEHWARAQEMIERTVATATRSHEARALAYALAARAHVHRSSATNRMEERIADLDRALEISNTSFQDRALAVPLHLERMNLRLEQGDRRGFEGESERVRAAAGQSPFWAHLVSCVDATRCLLDGRFERAVAIIATLDDAEAMSRGAAPATRAGYVVAARWEQGRMGELVPLVRTISSQLPYLLSVTAMAPMAMLEAGELDAARHRYEEVVAPGLAHFVGQMSWQAGFVILSYICERLGDAKRARELYEHLLPFRESCAVVGVGNICAGPVSLTLARMAMLLGNLRAAESHLGRARGLAESLQSPPWRARCLLAAAKLYRERSGPGDAARLADAAARSEAIARELGMTAVLRELSEMRSVGSKTSSRRPARVRRGASRT